MKATVSLALTVVLLASSALAAPRHGPQTRVRHAYRCFTSQVGCEGLAIFEGGPRSFRILYYQDGQSNFVIREPDGTATYHVRYGDTFQVAPGTNGVPANYPRYWIGVE